MCDSRNGSRARRATSVELHPWQPTTDLTPKSIILYFRLKRFALTDTRRFCFRFDSPVLFTIFLSSSFHSLISFRSMRLVSVHHRVVMSSDLFFFFSFISCFLSFISLTHRVCVALSPSSPSHRLAFHQLCNEEKRRPKNWKHIEMNKLKKERQKLGLEYNSDSFGASCRYPKLVAKQRQSHTMAGTSWKKKKNIFHSFCCTVHDGSGSSSEYATRIVIKTKWMNKEQPTFAEKTHKMAWKTKNMRRRRRRGRLYPCECVTAFRQRQRQRQRRRQWWRRMCQQYIVIAFTCSIDCRLRSVS